MRKSIKLMNEIKEEQTKWKGILRSWTGRRIIFKMAALTNLI